MHEVTTSLKHYDGKELERMDEGEEYDEDEVDDNAANNSNEKLDDLANGVERRATVNNYHVQ